MKRFIKAAIRGLGYEIRKTEKEEGRRHDSAEARECIEFIRRNTMVMHDVLLSLFEQAVFCEINTVPGSFVECGVWKGGCIGLMALANLKYGSSRRHIHLFDAFQEICEPDASVDGERAVREVRELSREPGFSGRLRPLTGIYDRFGGPGTLQQNKELLEQKIGYPSQFLHYHVGWFQDTLPRDGGSVGDIAILRLDGDWYASTKVCLTHLYDGVVRGGFVIIDDYGAYDGCCKAVDEFVESLSSPVFLSYVDKDCRYWIKP
jgi:O-methyltransferase